MYILHPKKINEYLQLLSFKQIEFSEKELTRTHDNVQAIKEKFLNNQYSENTVFFDYLIFHKYVSNDTKNFLKNQIKNHEKFLLKTLRFQYDRINLFFLIINFLKIFKTNYEDNENLEKKQLYFSKELIMILLDNLFEVEEHNKLVEKSLDDKRDPFLKVLIYLFEEKKKKFLSYFHLETSIEKYPQNDLQILSLKEDQRMISSCLRAYEHYIEIVNSELNKKEWVLIELKALPRYDLNYQKLKESSIKYYNEENIRLPDEKNTSRTVF